MAGLDWVAANHKKPAVVTLSLGIQVGSWSRVLEDAVRNLALQHNVTVRRGLGRRTGHAVQGMQGAAAVVRQKQTRRGAALGLRMARLARHPTSMQAGRWRVLASATAL